MNKFFQPFACASLIVFGVGVGPAISQTADQETPEMPDACEVLDSSKLIRIMVCSDPAYGHEEFIAAGRVACGTVLPCGTWIWRDAANAPEEAPELHDGLNQEQVTSAAGVWVAEQGNFVSIEQVKE